MNKENKLIPELRFPIFKNEGEWEVEELNKLGELINGLTYSPDDVSDKGLLVLRSSNIQNGMIELNDCVYVREDIKGANLSKPNDILVCVRNGSKNLIGKNAIIPKGLPLSTHGAFMTVFRANNPEFVFQLFQTDFYDTQVKADLGATINSINGKNFLKYEFPIPKNPKEQEKIASCLSSLDETIKAHSQKLEVLNDHKKGLMQNLFPQEGEKMPKYRFKEFEQDGEWADKTIDDVCKLVRGPFGGALKKEIFVKEGYAVYEQSHAIYSNFSSFRYFIDEDKFNELKRFSVKSGDLIMSCSGTMGKFAIVPEDCKIGVINQALLKLSVKKGFDKIFVKMTLEADNNQEKLLSQSAGGAIKNVVSVSQIKELSLLLPSIKEQQIIASCLSSLDDLITAQDEKIEQLKLHKKGLMQGLFPKINN